MRSALVTAILAVAVGAATSAALADNNVSRLAQEERIAALLHQRIYWSFPHERPRGPPDIDMVFGDAPPPPGRLAVELTARFEGCVLVTDFLRRADMLRIVTRYDLALVETNAPSATTQEVSNAVKDGLANWTSVSFPFWPWVTERLSQTFDKEQQLQDNANRLFPSDITGRIAWLQTQRDRALVDKTYLSAGGETSTYGDGAVDTGPGTFATAIFALDPSFAETFTGSLHDYASAYCPARDQPPPPVSPA